MGKKMRSPITLTISILGGRTECTLFPIDNLPMALRTYEKILITAKELDLTELPEISRMDMQEIFKALAFTLSECGIDAERGAVIWLSGTHPAYSLLDPLDKEQPLETCVTSMTLFVWDDTTVSTKGIICGGPVDMTLEEIPITELWETEVGDYVYCLFLGT